jgi:serine phosphatase RsbU (regulator of sigma subunit)
MSSSKIDLLEKAKKYCDSAITMDKRVKHLEGLQWDYEFLIDVQKQLEDFKNAFESYEYYVMLKDSISNGESGRRISQLEKSNEEDLKQKEIEIQKLQIASDKKERWYFISGVITLILLLGFAFNRFKVSQKQKDIIAEQKSTVEEKQKEILDSIEYALRIQTAILPPQKIVKQYLENSFILYKPKDIVAGDFYWMETINDLVLFAACDCTGHGVPGAMVSVVCHNALNRAVREFGLTQPAAILDKTAEIVIENFSKSEEEIKDGMDISLCAYNAKTKSIQWAGANNPLWLLQNGELIETKADKQPIGRDENSKAFTNHTFTLQTGETIYLFTDGFADQFGGDTGQKKLTKKRFKDLILSVQNKTLQEQGIALDKFITEYRKSVEQIDDILVMGVKV